MTKLVTAGRWFLQIVRSIEASGIDCQALCKEAGIDYATLEDNDGRIDMDLASKFWVAVTNKTNNPEIGLELATDVRIGGLKALGYSLLSSDTVKDALQRLVRYQQIMGESGNFHFEQDHDNYVLCIELMGNMQPVPHQAIDAGFASIFHYVGWILHKKVVPIAVQLQRSSPKSVKPYERVFNCIPVFEQDRNAIVFDKATVESQLPTADKALAELHDEIVDRDLAALSTDRLSQQVRALIIKKISGGDIILEEVLTHFSLGKRTFQRKLKEEGYTFLQLVDETRKSMAKKYVEEGTMTFEEVAFLLGFTEHGNFSRAFKRWYDCTPGQYRTKYGAVS